MNYEIQNYYGINLRLIPRKGYPYLKAKRFVLLPRLKESLSNQNVWIPNKNLDEDGTIKKDENIDYVFMKSRRQCELAGYKGIRLKNFVL